MKLVNDEAAFRELIVRHAADLPPQQKTIADFLLENLHVAAFLSVPELARRTGSSEATVVRFAQRIGYEGFSDLKMDMVDLLQERLGGALPTPAGDDGDVLGAVAALELENIRRTVESLDREAFTRTAEAFFAAEHSYVFGMGVSAHLAELAVYSLVQIGLRTTALSTRFSSPREQLVALRPGDLLLVLSFPPYSRQTLDMLEEARERGAATVAICDRLTAPAAALAEHVLPIRSDNMMFTNAVAAVTVLINALATQIATAHRPEALEAIARINRILSTDGSVIPPR